MSPLIPMTAALALAAPLVLTTGDTCSSKAAQACSSGANTAFATGEQDIVDTAVAAGSFNTLAAALDAAGLVEALKGEGPFTVFAPTDEAFAKLPKGVVADLLKPENKGKLTQILTYHVVSGEVAAKDVVELDRADTLGGQRIDIRVDEGAVMIDGSKVVKADIRCTNGIIHVIDTVLIPNTNDIVTTAVEAGSFKTLAAALEAAGLVEALQGEGPFTVFAPTDAAFAKLPEGTVASLLKPENRAQLKAILTYHVVKGRVYSDQALAAGKATTLQGGKLPISVQGDKVKVGGAFVVGANVEASNGVIHVIDTVLLPE